MNKKVVVIGGGIIGLSSAYYLQKAGYRVVVLDRSDFMDNCSYVTAVMFAPVILFRWLPRVSYARD